MNAETTEGHVKKTETKPTRNGYPSPSKAGRKVLQTLTEDMPVDLSTEELVKVENEFHKQWKELRNHEAYVKQVRADLKARQEAINSNLSSLHLKRDGGTELRPVLLAVEADYENGVVETVRTDTGAVVRTRPLKTEERQGSMPFEPEGEEAALALPPGAAVLEDDDEEEIGDDE